MNKKYKPNAAEVVDEIFKSTFNYLGNLESFKKAGKEFLSIAAGIGTFPYFLPTNIRYSYDEFKPLIEGDINYSPIEVIANVGGIATGIGIIFAQNDIVEKLNVNNVCCIIAANVISLGYETVRAARKRLIDKHNKNKF